MKLFNVLWSLGYNNKQETSGRESYKLDVKVAGTSGVLRHHFARVITKDSKRKYVILYKESAISLVENEILKETQITVLNNKLISTCYIPQH